MNLPQQRVVGLYVDRSIQQWIARDSQGQLWVVPVTGTPWENRQPYQATEGVELVPVPGHYRAMLGIHFDSERGAA